MNIKIIRKERGMTQKKLAEISGISFSMISKLESGEKKNPSYETLEKIADALEVPVSVLTSKDEIISFKLERLNKKIDKYASNDSDTFLDMLDPFEEILNSYDQLNELGQEKLLTYIEDLLMIDKYTK